MSTLGGRGDGDDPGRTNHPFGKSGRNDSPPETTLTAPDETEPETTLTAPDETEEEAPAEGSGATGDGWGRIRLGPNAYFKHPPPRTKGSWKFSRRILSCNIPVDDYVPPDPEPNVTSRAQEGESIGSARRGSAGMEATEREADAGAKGEGFHKKIVKSNGYRTQRQQPQQRSLGAGLSGNAGRAAEAVDRETSGDGSVAEEETTAVNEDATEADRDDEGHDHDHDA